MNERFNRSDFIFLGVCLFLAAISVAVAVRWFDSAFPEASIDFKVNRGESQAIAKKFLDDAALTPPASAIHTAQFDHDDSAKIYLERTVGLERANALMKRDVKVWYWRNRWFRPLQREEVRVDIAPTGEIVSFEHVIPEENAMPGGDAAALRPVAEAFLSRAGVPPANLNFIAQGEVKLPKRVQTTFTWESKTIRPAATPYRYTVKFDGAQISGFTQSLKVPDKWTRDYSELRSKNEAAGAVDSLFMILTILAAIAVFVIRLRRGDSQVRFVIAVGIIAFALIFVMSLNEFPSALAGYDTTDSFTAFVTKALIGAFFKAIAMGLVLVVIVGAGEPLFRERFPNHLAIPRLFRFEALRSRRVFRGFILGYTLVAVFLAYQVLFYVISSHFGAWAPADIPYDDILNTVLPWVAVLFMGFYPAVSEEFMSRAFSIPFFEKFLHSRAAAIILAGFIWGFGHAAYPNQPFYIRGVEVGIAGVVIGMLMYRFGILPLLVWHYTVDALYTSLLLFRSGNVYYIVSAGVGTLIFALPLLASIVLYFKNGGFANDEALENAAIGTTAAPPPAPELVAAPQPIARQFVTPARLVFALVAIVLAAVLVMTLTSTLDGVADYRITADQATAIANRDLAARRIAKLPEKHVVAPDEGFRTWDAKSGREDGGSPGGFDDVSLAYILQKSKSLDLVIATLRSKIEGATYVVRMFTPREKEEIFVEIDPRTSKPVGFHEYQEETVPGATLEQAAAEAIALREFPRYGLSPVAFERKEALNFQQPKRRDWLFHYDERQPITGGALRRVSIRVAGDRVTQFVKTVRIPEAERIEREKTVAANTIFLVLKIFGWIFLVAVVVTGYVLSLRKGGFPWKRPLRIAAALAIPAALFTISQWKLFFTRYDTSIEWNTFMVVIGVGMVAQIGFQLLVIFLAVSAAEAIEPGTRRLLSAAARASLGARAIVAALGAAGAIVALNAALRALPRLLPQWSAPGFSVSPAVVLPAPWFSAIWQAVLATILVSGAVACIALALREAPEKFRAWLPLGIVVAGACALLDTSARSGEIALTIVTSLVVSAVVYLVARYALGGNLLAVPLAIFTVRMIGRISDLMGNDRPDLQAAGYVVIVVLVLTYAWVALTAKWGREESAPTNLPVAEA